MQVNDTAIRTAATRDQQAVVLEEITENLYALHDQASAAGDVAKENNKLSAKSQRAEVSSLPMLSGAR